ncbi:hypothetical protein ACQBAT_06700 [Ornithinimicrobium sp. Y1847]|uniref:hypothetical protein n=1 Tax=Ornithinimicrobium sp. Y1847 TaxID=3405419 RepID=UPI003B679FE9
MIQAEKQVERAGRDVVIASAAGVQLGRVSVTVHGRQHPLSDGTRFEIAMREEVIYVRTEMDSVVSSRSGELRLTDPWWTETIPITSIDHAEVHDLARLGRMAVASLDNAWRERELRLEQARAWLSKVEADTRAVALARMTYEDVVGSAAGGIEPGQGHEDGGLTGREAASRDIAAIVRHRRDALNSARSRLRAAQIAYDGQIGRARDLLELASREEVTATFAWVNVTRLSVFVVERQRALSEATSFSVHQVREAAHDNQDYELRIVDPAWSETVPFDRRGEPAARAFATVGVQMVAELAESRAAWERGVGAARAALERAVSNTLELEQARAAYAALQEAPREVRR